MPIPADLQLILREVKRPFTPIQLERPAPTSSAKTNPKIPMLEAALQIDCSDAQKIPRLRLEGQLFHRLNY